MASTRRRRILLICLCVVITVIVTKNSGVKAFQSTSSSELSIAPTPPSELNPQGGGAPKATFEQAANFAWEEFFALNWPAGPQNGQPLQRDTPSKTCRFGDPNCSGPLVWETFRGKVEIFPGNTNPFAVVPPPGYPGPQGDTSFGYDALPVYNYSTPINACDSKQAKDATPWVNLDETDQITLDNMYAGVVQPNSSPGNSSPQLIRFLAKASRAQYVYVAGNSTPLDPNRQWWLTIPPDVVTATKAYLKANQASPPPNSKDKVSLPNGTIEVKAGWRPLNPSEASSGRFHMQAVRFYENGSGTAPCYRDATWGLVSLHIIQKTPSAPYFIYATFEQADNILTADGRPVEDPDGNLIMQPPPAATAPQVCLVDPPPQITPPPSGDEVTSKLGSVILTADPTRCKPIQTPAYCGSPGNRLYLRNAKFSPPLPEGEPSGGNICIEKRENAIPDYTVKANTEAHAAISSYLKKSGIASAPWIYYKLVNVQYFPYDKVISKQAPNGSLYTAKPPYTATNPSPSSFYQANIVVETNRSLQLFSGGLSPSISTDWNQDGTQHKNTHFGGHFYNMGGCMGCHGSQGQNPAMQAGDFSVILARGIVSQPETPALATSQGMTAVERNRSLK